MEEVRFTKDNELIVNDILKNQNKIENEELKKIGEKFVICAGALAVTHGFLMSNDISFTAGVFAGTMGLITLLHTKKISKTLENNQKKLIKSLN